MTKFLAWGIIAMFLIVLVGTYFVFVAVASQTPDNAPEIIDAIRDYNARVSP
jgi:cbb3-type cytochrome oxidase subunit 3